jgi:hypothetical protein
VWQILAAVLLLQDAAKPIILHTDPPPPAPVVIQVPSPMPVDLGPAAEIQLVGDSVYVIGSSQPLLILSTNPEALQIEHSEGPVRVFARLHGSPRAVWSTFGDSHVYLLTAKSTGTTTVFFVSSLEADSVVKRTFVVSGGGPQPPPGPAPQPQPQPQPQPKPSDGIRVMLLADETDDPAALLAISSLTVRQWLDQNCRKTASGQPEWRRYDRSTISVDGELDEDDPVFQKLWSAVRPQLPDGPQAVIAVGTQVDIVPVSDTDSLLSELKRLSGR